MPPGTELTQHSNPYYRSVYVALVRRDGPLAGSAAARPIRACKDKRIGIVAATPPADHLTELGLDRPRPRPIRSSSTGATNRRPTRWSADLLGGQDRHRHPLGADRRTARARRDPELELVPLVHEEERPPLAFRITMAMRPNELEWKRTINTVLRRREADITKVLLDAGVPLLDEEGNVVVGRSRTP